MIGPYRNALMSPCGVTVDRADNPVLVRVCAIAAQPVAPTHWTRRKFSTEYPYCIELIRLRLRLRPSLSYGLINGTSCRRGPEPQHRSALVQPGRATAGTPYRTVRERALAPLSHRTRFSREHPGSQGRRRNLA